MEHGSLVDCLHPAPCNLPVGSRFILALVGAQPAHVEAAIIRIGRSCGRLESVTAAKVDPGMLGRCASAVPAGSVPATQLESAHLSRCASAVPASYRAGVSREEPMVASSPCRCCCAWCGPPKGWESPSMGGRDMRSATVCLFGLGTLITFLHPAIVIVRIALGCDGSPAGVSPTDIAGGCTLVPAAWWRPRASAIHARFDIRATISRGNTMSSGVCRLTGTRRLGQVLRRLPAR